LETGTMAIAAHGAKGDARSARMELSLRAGLLAGRYLHEYHLAESVADDAFAGWLMLDQKPAGPAVEQWWDEYVNRIESRVGGYDNATTEQLEEAWLVHAHRLLD
jgi:hypothetical protein